MPKRFALRKAGAIPILYYHDPADRSPDGYNWWTANKEEALAFESYEEAEKAKKRLGFDNLVIFLLTA